MNYSQNYNEWRVIVINSKDLRPVLLDMANSITKNELWDWLKNFELKKGTTYGFCRSKNIIKIKNDLKLKKFHNERIFSYCMKQMKFISVNDFDKWNNNKK